MFCILWELCTSFVFYQCQTIQKQKGYRGGAESRWCAGANREPRKRACIQVSLRPPHFQEQIAQAVPVHHWRTTLVGRGISGQGFWNKNHLLHDLVHLLIIIKYFETSFHHQKLQFVLFFPKPYCKKREKKHVALPKLEGLCKNLPFHHLEHFILGVFLLKRMKHFFCIYYLFCFCSWFVPKLRLSHGTWWLSDLDSFCIHCPLRMISLGWLLLPGLLEPWEFQVWIGSRELFPLCISHSPKAQNAHKQRQCSLPREAENVRVEGPNYRVLPEAVMWEGEGMVWNTDGEYVTIKKHFTVVTVYVGKFL